MKRKKSTAFTMLEILLVVAAISILAAIVIVAINPTKQLIDTRNAQRWADVNTILNAIYQFNIDNGGIFPSAISNPVSDGDYLPDPPFEGGDYLYYVLGDDTDGDPTCSDTCQALTDRSITPEANCIDISDDLVSGDYITAIPVDPRFGEPANTRYYVARTGPDGMRITVGACDQDR